MWCVVVFGVVCLIRIVLCIGRVWKLLCVVCGWVFGLCVSFDVVLLSDV